MDNNKNTVKQIDFYKMVKVVLKSGKTYLKVLPATFILACLYILCIPRYYRCNVSLAPELSNASSLSSMAGLASSFGIDLAGSLSSEDAISPELYPDLMGSTNFVVSLFPIEIKTKDGKIATTYYEYLKSYQKAPWWSMAMGKVKDLFADKDTVKFDGKGRVDPFALPKTQQDIVSVISKKVSCSVDKKTDVISISVEDQDPLVCATIADSVREKLQDFITDYRTNKARNDLEHTKKLYIEAKQEYEKARQMYATFSDANQELVLESYKAKQTDLENEMQLRYNIYTNLATQLQMAQSKVLERTPAFTTLKCATVPIKPAGPKRMFFVAIITFLAFVVTTAYKYIKAE